MLTKAGAKLLDFGLAKPTAMAMGADSMMPTMSEGITAQGSILGTLQYMAPEQLEGDDVDARTDIFAFGTVVYEMITGTKTFSGKSQASLIGSILKDEPRALTELQPVSPPALDRVVKKCLAKDPERRWHSAHDLHDELIWIREAGANAAVSAAPSPSESGRSWLLASLVAAVVLGGVVVWALTRTGPMPPSLPTRFAVSAPTDAAIAPGAGLTVSPDGRTVVFPGVGSNGIQLYKRSLDGVESVPMPGTEGTWAPFFSPDGEWVGYFSPLGDQQVLKKIRLNGSSNPVTLCPAPGGWRSASWSADDTIVFSSAQNGVWRVSANGGEPELIRPPESPIEDTPRWLEVLPDGQAALATVGRTPEAEIVVVDLTTGEQETLLTGTWPRYISTGHVAYWREDSLWAVPFDAERRELAGSPVPVVEDVGMNSVANGLAGFAVGGDSLVYAPVQGLGFSTQLVWVDRDGSEEDAGSELGNYLGLALSPDGQRAAVAADGDVLAYDLVRDTATRLTFDLALTVFQSGRSMDSASPIPRSATATGQKWTPKPGQRLKWNLHRVSGRRAEAGCAEVHHIWRPPTK